MEPFKEFINHRVIETLGDIYKRVWPAFDRGHFVEDASRSLSDLELKQRVLQVATSLNTALPEDFDEAARILLASLHPSEDTARDGIEFGPEGANNWAVWPLTELVVMRGFDHPEASLAVLKEMTKRSSSEFAVRPFLAEQPDVALPVFYEWARDPNRHVRRLASEGSRPRLPWGMRLHSFVKDPVPLLPILETLKDDPEDYVRRSVANNLNDIAKDHPDLVADIASKWLLDASRERQRLVKHACRTLIKQGHPGALGAFGYRPVEPKKAALSVLTPTVTYGDALEFELSLDGLPSGGNLLIDYAIHFVKANGELAPKVFKWKDMQSFASKNLKAERRHAIKPITTRKYYPGRHMIEIIVNGAPVAQADFELLMP